MVKQECTSLFKLNLFFLFRISSTLYVCWIQGFPSFETINYLTKTTRSCNGPSGPAQLTLFSFFKVPPLGNIALVSFGAAVVLSNIPFNYPAHYYVPRQDRQCCFFSNARNGSLIILWPPAYGRQ